MKRLALLIPTLIVLVVLLFILFLPLYKVISFTETRTNNPIMHYINISKEDVFQIRFTHSIHLTDVLETYEMTNSNKLKLVSMEYEDVAVGMPAYAEEGQKLVYENGKYKLSYDNNVIEDFTLYIGNVDYDLFLKYDGEEYDLKTSLKRGSSYFVEVKRVSLYDKLKGVLIRNEN